MKKYYTFDNIEGTINGKKMGEDPANGESITIGDPPTDERLERLAAEAKELAKVWLVHAYKKLVADIMTGPDDVMSAFEIAFVDGYMTGEHAGHKAGYRARDEDVAALVEALKAIADTPTCSSNRDAGDHENTWTRWAKGRADAALTRFRGESK